MQKLYETYENCATIIGLEPLSDLQVKSKSDDAVLLPIAHTLLKAHITVDLDGSGNILGAQAREDVTGTIAPCTEDSESRAGTMPPPHPLFDKLQYLAGDFGTYTGETAGHFHQAYLAQLANWSQSEFSNPMVAAIYQYLNKGQLITDLVEKHVLFLDQNKRLIDKWEGSKESAPDIFKIRNCTPSEVFVRFTVNIPGIKENRVWMDSDVRSSFIQYTLWQQNEKRLCYVTGKNIPFIEKHPKKIINTLANAKLISANDNSGFTYRGRFSEGGQAVSIGYDTSLKAHNALRWLVQTRGRRFDTKVILAWDTGNNNIPSPVDSSEDAFGEESGRSAADLLQESDVRTDRRYSVAFNKAVACFSHTDPGFHGEIIVMALDCSTVGRLSITYYRELRRSEYIDRITNWYNTCVWLLPGRNNEEKRSYVYLGTPSANDIAQAVYGSKGSDKLKKSVPERLFASIFDGVSLPEDLILATARRASNPVSMEWWEWNKTLCIACALYKKKYEKEGYTLALDENRTDRSYLFGRLLAVADQIERWALSGEDRETNAMRYMNVFSKKPVDTWRVISERLRPYQSRLKGKAARYNDLITSITDRFLSGEFDKKPEESLNGAYLLGFHNQRQVFINERDERKRQIEAAKLRGQQIDIDDDNAIMGGTEQ